MTRQLSLFGRAHSSRGKARFMSSVSLLGDQILAVPFLAISKPRQACLPLMKGPDVICHNSNYFETCGVVTTGCGA